MHILCKYSLCLELSVLVWPQNCTLVDPLNNLNTMPISCGFNQGGVVSATGEGGKKGWKTAIWKLLFSAFPYLPWLQEAHAISKTFVAFVVWHLRSDAFFFLFKREPRAKPPRDYFGSQAFPGNQVFTERCFVQTFSGALYA